MVNMFLSVEFGGEMEWLLRCRAWCTGYIHGCPENCLQLCISMWWGISLLYADSYRQIMPSSNSDRMQLRFFFHMFISLPFMSLIYIYIYIYSSVASNEKPDLEWNHIYPLPIQQSKPWLQRLQCNHESLPVSWLQEVPTSRTVSDLSTDAKRGQKLCFGSKQ